jgi:arylamine N-acetyltransferase
MASRRDGRVGEYHSAPDKEKIFKFLTKYFFVDREHSVNIVTLSDETQYLADVGYGGNGPKVPLPLISGSVVHNLGTQDLRLVRETTIGLSDGQQGRWIYQFRNAEDQAWAIGYSFTDIKFTLKDFEVMNFFTSRSPDSFLTTKILVVKFLQENGNITGKIIMDQEQVKKNTGGKNTLLQTCQTEEERVQVLEKLFKLKLTEEEKNGIRGRISSLKTEV